MNRREVTIKAPATGGVGAVELSGELDFPVGPAGLVVFAHGSGSSRLSPRNRGVAEALGVMGLGTLLFDLLTEREAAMRSNVFDIPLLGARLNAAASWLREQPESADLPVGYFGASTGAAAALWAAADAEAAIGAIVSRGGRPDLAGERLADVTAPTLLIVGQRDPEVMRLNQLAQERLKCHRVLAVIPGASHLFEEPGALDRVADLAGKWFVRFLRRPEED